MFTRKRKDRILKIIKQKNTPTPKNKIWNSLEITKLIISISIPGLLLWLGTVIKEMENDRVNETRVINLRFQKYEEMAFYLNDIYAYFTYRGNWKELTPIDVIYRKRQADKIRYIYEPLFSKSFIQKYDSFISSCFIENSGRWGKDALLNTEYENRMYVKPTTRFIDGKYESFSWNKSWDSLFISKYDHNANSIIGIKKSSFELNNQAEVIQATYFEMSRLLSQELNLDTQNTNKPK